MPKGIPNIITNYDRNRDRRREIEAELAPKTEVLGHLGPSAAVLNEPPTETTTWTREDGTVVELTEPAPPWVTTDDRWSPSDAHRFVECPPNWKLRWINPRLLESEGWRDWQAILTTDSRVKVRVPSMVTPENYIRRGGPKGDILCWMWAGWYESLRLKNLEKTHGQTQSAVDQQRKVTEELKRGTYGPYIRAAEAVHPTHTMGDGQSMRDS